MTIISFFVFLVDILECWFTEKCLRSLFAMLTLEELTLDAKKEWHEQDLHSHTVAHVTRH